MSNNILIVEGKEDQLFMENIIPNSSLVEFEILDGIDNWLKRKDSIIRRIEKGCKKIGIIVDADEAGISQRIEKINSHIKLFCSDIDIAEQSEFYFSNELMVDLSCHVLNIEGKGNLDTLLKKTKSKDSSYADCLDSWQNCLGNTKKLSPTKFNKLWVNVYIRYDCCDKEEEGNAGSNCTFAASLKKDIWNFSHPALTDLKNYLAKFN